MVQRRWDTTLLSTTISTIHSHYFSIQRSPLHRIASHRIASYHTFTKAFQSCTPNLLAHGHNISYRTLILISSLATSTSTSFRSQHNNMCFYHAYSHICGHTQMILQQLCSKGQMKQQKCARGQDGTILATVKVETPCGVCPGRVC
jgi:hypothetical protein